MVGEPQRGGAGPRSGPRPRVRPARSLPGSVCLDNADPGTGDGDSPQRRRTETSFSSKGTGPLKLGGKAYEEAVKSLTSRTVVKVADFDQKALQLLDILQQRGRAKEACQYLKQAVEGIDRDHTVNWRAYIYTLLRRFDEAAYKEMKNSKEGRRNTTTGTTSELQAQSPTATTKSFNPLAPEFVPSGFLWDAGSLSFALAAAAGVPPMPPMPPTQRSSCTGQTATAEVGDAERSGDAAALPSVGSAGHWQRICKPCAFMNTKGCSNGYECKFCHLCAPGEKKRRARETKKVLNVSAALDAESPVKDNSSQAQ